MADTGFVEDEGTAESTRDKLVRTRPLTSRSFPYLAVPTSTQAPSKKVFFATISKRIQKCSREVLTMNCGLNSKAKPRAFKSA